MQDLNPIIITVLGQLAAVALKWGLDRLAEARKRPQLPQRVESVLASPANRARARRRRPTLHPLA